MKQKAKAAPSAVPCLGSCCCCVVVVLQLLLLLQSTFTPIALIDLGVSYMPQQSEAAAPAAAAQSQRLETVPNS